MFICQYFQLFIGKQEISTEYFGERSNFRAAAVIPYNFSSDSWKFVKKLRSPLERITFVRNKFKRNSKRQYIFLNRLVVSYWPKSFNLNSISLVINRRHFEYQTYFVEVRCETRLLILIISIFCFKISSEKRHR